MRTLVLILALSGSVFATPKKPIIKSNTPAFCTTGPDIVVTEYDDKGCMVSSACVLTANCSKTRDPLCEGGKIVHPGFEKDGCPKSAVCIMPGDCKEFPVPTCEGGKIVMPGYLMNGCKKASVCVMPDQCSH